VDFSGDCWLWTASKIRNGYGRYKLNGETVYAHLFSWEYFNGEIDKGLSVLHKCDVRNCVNPNHLFLGTQKDNMVDMIAKGRAIHPKGLELKRLKENAIHSSSISKAVSYVQRDLLQRNKRAAVQTS
jgi:hypothetical protein